MLIFMFEKRNHNYRNVGSQEECNIILALQPVCLLGLQLRFWPFEKGRPYSLDGTTGLRLLDSKFNHSLNYQNLLSVLT